MEVGADVLPTPAVVRKPRQFRIAGVMRVCGMLLAVCGVVNVVFMIAFAMRLYPCVVRCTLSGCVCVRSAFILSVGACFSSDSALMTSSMHVLDLPLVIVQFFRVLLMQM